MDQIIGNLNDLLTAVQQLAHSEEHKIRQDAAEQATRIRTGAGEQAAKLRDGILARARQQAAKLRERNTATLVREARARYLVAREGWLVKVWEKTEERLHRLTENNHEYALALQNLFFMAVRSLDAGQLVLLLEEKGQRIVDDVKREEWQKQASRILGKPVSLEVAPQLLDAWGGLVVTIKGTTQQIDVTFSSRLEVARGELRELIFQTLMKRFE